MTETIYSIPKAAEKCGLHRVTLWKYVKAGEVPTFRTPGGQYRIHRDDLERFMREKGMYPYSAHQMVKKRVLIVDDDTAIRKILLRTLIRRGYEVESAADGFEAGLKTMKFHPHLVILDLFMPKTDGFEVCEQLKKNPDTADTRVIAISGYDTKENRMRIHACGADLFLPKPLDLKYVENAVKKVLG